MNGDEMPMRMQLCLRIPNWCAGKPVVTHSDFEPCEVLNDCICFSVKSGGEIEIEFPMEVTVHSLKDNKNIVALKYGPVVLAARLGQENLEQVGKTGIMVLRAVRDFSLPSFIVLNDDVENWMLNIKQNLIRIDDDNGVIQFKLAGTALGATVTLVPYNSIYNYRYGLYMNLVSKDSQEMMATILFNKQRLRSEEAASGLLMQMDGNNYEATYNLQASRSKIGCNSRGFRLARGGGWFSYDMPVKPDVVNYLNTVYNHVDNGRSIKILINGEDFATETISSAQPVSPDGFYTQTKQIPLKYTNGSNTLFKIISGELKPCITVEFQAVENESAGLYGISVTHGFDDNPNLCGLYFAQGKLHPEFDPGIKEYTLNLSANIKTVSMKVIPAKMSALVYHGDILIDDTQPRVISTESAAVALTVYAQNHESSTKYIIAINKQEL